MFLAVPTIAELEFGLAIARRANHPHIRALEAGIHGLIKDAQILDLDQDAALLLGRMWAEPSLRNFITTQPGARKTQRGTDLQIAAITLRHDATLVTHNTRDFQHISASFTPLRLYDPFTGTPH